MNSIKQCFTDVGGKLSSKRIAGALGWLASLGMVAMSGWGYSFTSELVTTALITSAGMLGASVFERIKDRISQ
jgi:spore maturation protein SpmB